MQTFKTLSELARAVHNLIRNGVDIYEATCRVQTGGNTTDWLYLLRWAFTCLVAPSEGELVLLLALGGELDCRAFIPMTTHRRHPPPMHSTSALLIVLSLSTNQKSLR